MKINWFLLIISIIKSSANYICNNGECSSSPIGNYPTSRQCISNCQNPIPSQDNDGNYLFYKCQIPSTITQHPEDGSIVTIYGVYENGTIPNPGTFVQAHCMTVHVSLANYSAGYIPSAFTNLNNCKLECDNLVNDLIKTNENESNQVDLRVINNCDFDLWMEGRSTISPTTFRTYYDSNGNPVDDLQLLHPGNYFDYSVPNTGFASTVMRPKYGCDNTGKNCKMGNAVPAASSCSNGICTLSTQGFNPTPPIDTIFEATWGCISSIYNDPQLYTQCVNNLSAPPGATGRDVKIGPSTFADVSHVDGYTLSYQLIPVGDTRNSKCFNWCDTKDKPSIYDKSCCIPSSPLYNISQCKTFCYGVSSVNSYKLNGVNCPTDENLTVPPATSQQFQTGSSPPKTVNLGDIDLRYYDPVDTQQIIGCMAPLQKFVQPSGTLGLGPLPNGVKLEDTIGSEFGCPTPNVCNLNTVLPKTSINTLTSLRLLSSTKNWSQYPQSSISYGTNAEDASICINNFSGKINRVCNRPQGTLYTHVINRDTDNGAYSFAYDDAYGLMEVPAKKTQFIFQLCPAGSKDYPSIDTTKPISVPCTCGASCDPNMNGQLYGWCNKQNGGCLYGPFTPNHDWCQYGGIGVSTPTTPISTDCSNCKNNCSPVISGTAWCDLNSNACSYTDAPPSGYNWCRYFPVSTATNTQSTTSISSTPTTTISCSCQTSNNCASIPSSGYGYCNKNGGGCAYISNPITPEGFEWCQYYPSSTIPTTTTITKTTISTTPKTTIPTTTKTTTTIPTTTKTTIPTTTKTTIPTTTKTTTTISCSCQVSNNCANIPSSGYGYCNKNGGGCTYISKPITPEGFEWCQYYPISSSTSAITKTSTVSTSCSCQSSNNCVNKPSSGYGYCNKNGGGCAYDFNPITPAGFEWCQYYSMSHLR